MKSYKLLFITCLFIPKLIVAQKTTSRNVIVVERTADFELSGEGIAANWEHANWNHIDQRAHLDNDMETRFKVLYSGAGIYFLFNCEDPLLAASLLEDYQHLWTEDVIEVFLWPDTAKIEYFEYELSPLNYELPLMVVKIDEQLHRWQPWFYEDDRAVIHQVSTQGGAVEPGASIESWTGEFYIPYSLLALMGNVPPEPGTKWKANMYRMDYLDGKEIYWSWQYVPGSFHATDYFGTLLFK